VVREHFAPIVNLADAWQRLAIAQPAAPALVHDGRIVTWADFARRAAGLAHHLVTSGCRQQDTVTQFLRNTPHYLESIFACAAAGLVPVAPPSQHTAPRIVHALPAGSG